ncbi:hypothetical protein ABG067_001351 [Albugo candida]
MDDNAQKTSKGSESNEMKAMEKIRIKLCKKNGEKSFGMGLGKKMVKNKEKPPSYASQIYVLHVLRNSPAERENVQKGWRIEQVEGKTVEGYNLQSLASLMRSSSSIEVDFEISQNQQQDERQDKIQTNMLLLERYTGSQSQSYLSGFGKASLRQQYIRCVPPGPVNVSTKTISPGVGKNSEAHPPESSACIGDPAMGRKRADTSVAPQAKDSHPQKQMKMTVWAKSSNMMKAQPCIDANKETPPHLEEPNASSCKSQHPTNSIKVAPICPQTSEEAPSRSSSYAVRSVPHSNNASKSDDLRSELSSQKPTGESNRQRHSLTTRRLTDMGFDKTDAVASIAACGDDPEKCMVWIAAQLEEKQFISDLNQASIQSELSKQKEAASLKHKEKELYKKARVFTSLFPNSYILSDRESNTLKEVIDEQIGRTDSECLLRTTLTRLLKLEAQAIKWYKVAARCYLLRIAENLEGIYIAESHSVFECCGKATSLSACTFVKSIQTEVELLQNHLFNMPKIHGGVPMAFLEADESTKFNLEDDGFEVIDK